MPQGTKLDSQFYTYMWLRENGTPYYVGKGVGRRAFIAHNHKVALPPRGRILVEEFLSEADAFTAEIFLIEFYGREDLRTGILLNRSAGGKQNSYSRKGCKNSPEHRIKISLAQRGNKNGIRNKSRLGKTNPPECRRKIGIANAGRVMSTENREKLRQCNLGNNHCLGRKMSEESRHKISISNRGRVRSEQAKQKMRAAWTRRKERLIATGNPT